jgi:hypothetical protein
MASPFRRCKTDFQGTTEYRFIATEAKEMQTLAAIIGKEAAKALSRQSGQISADSLNDF